MILQRKTEIQRSPDLSGFCFAIGLLTFVGLLAGVFVIDQFHDWFGDKNWTGPFTWDQP